MAAGAHTHTPKPRAIITAIPPAKQDRAIPQMPVDPALAPYLPVTNTCTLATDRPTSPLLPFSPSGRLPVWPSASALPGPAHVRQHGKHGVDRSIASAVSEPTMYYRCYAPCIPLPYTSAGAFAVCPPPTLHANLKIRAEPTLAQLISTDTLVVVPVTPMCPTVPTRVRDGDDVEPGRGMGTLAGKH